MKRLRVGDEGLNRLAGIVALVVLASLWLCVAAGLFFGLLSVLSTFVDVSVFLNPTLDTVLYVGFPLGVALGWYAVYRLWKQCLYYNPLSSARQIIKLFSFLLFIALVAFCTCLLFVMVVYVVAFY
jgi:hypothetical protein